MCVLLVVEHGLCLLRFWYDCKLFFGNLKRQEELQQTETFLEALGKTVTPLFPTSLCGVLVFGSVSRRLLPPPPSASSSFRSHTTCPHTTCPHTTCPTELTHTQLVHTDLAHTQLVHTQLVITQLAHTQLVNTYSHTTCPHTTSHTKLNPHTTCPHRPCSQLVHLSLGRRGTW